MSFRSNMRDDGRFVNPTDEEPKDDVMRFLFDDEEDEDDDETAKSDVPLRGEF